MATESPLLHDGGQTVLSTSLDARRSSITGSTGIGPNGSLQFIAVRLSTTVDRTIIASTAQSVACYGILQNTPGPGQACDVGIFGISKAIAGSTFVSGNPLIQGSSGALTTYSTGTGQAGPIATSLETVTAVGQVFTCRLYGGLGGLGGLI